MSVISVREMWSPAVSAIQGTRFQAARGWTVRVTPGTDPMAVLTAVDPADKTRRVARWGEEYPGHRWLVCRDVTPEHKGPNVYQVIAGYELQSEAGFEDDPTAQQGPLGKPSEMRWDFVVGSEPVEEDVHGQAIVNAAGEPFDPAPMENYADPRLTIVRYRRSFDVQLAIAYSGRRGCTNSDPFMGSRPGQAKLLPISGDQLREGKATYWRESYVIEFREGLPKTADGGGPERAWWLRVLNQGHSQILGTWGEKGFDPEVEAHKTALKEGLTGEQEQALAVQLAGTPVVRRVKDLSGEVTATPVRLDRDGKVLKRGKKPVYLEFQIRPSKPFSKLKLP